MKTVTSFLQQFLRAVRTRGLKGALSRASGALWWRLHRFAPHQREARRIREASDREFDSRLGVDTGGNVPLIQLQIDSQNWTHGVEYWASDPEEFRAALKSTGVPLAGRTFVDFGCGKGRTLILASEFPFEKIVGVEFSAELVDIATRNVAAMQRAGKRGPGIEVLCLDAVQYALPEGPLVLYFFHPFHEEVMEPVIRNIVDSYRASPREIVVIYANPVVDHAWAKVDFLEKIVSKDGCSIYRTRRMG